MKRKYNKKKFISLRALISLSVIITVSQFLDASKNSLYMYKHMYMGMYFLNLTSSMLCTDCTLLFAKKGTLSCSIIGVP